MTSSDDWSHPEIVRNLKALTEAVKDLVTEVRRLDEKYVPRELQRIRDEHVDGRLNDIGTAVADLAADQERHRREHVDEAHREASEAATTWRAWVAPIVTGLTVALFAVLLTNLIGG